MRTAHLTLFAWALIAPISWISSASACELCGPVGLTFSEQMDQADAVALVKWVSAQKAKPGNEEDGKPAQFAKTTYEVVEVVKNSNGAIKKAGEIVLPEYRSGKAGDLALLFGLEATRLEWGTPVEVTNAGYNYIADSPGSREPIVKRLEYFLKYLEFPDQDVANDAYGEFANAPFVEIRKLKDKFPRERIRKWISNPETAVNRLGLYGLMLGLCGNEDEAKLMSDYISQPAVGIRVGVDGIMAGYLLLKGDEGLKLLEDTKLRPGVKVPFSETLAAMQAIRFAWNYGEIKKDRLRQSLRILLDRPEVADLVIADLARWKDWTIQDKLMKLYDKKDYDIPSIKRAIVRYMLVCSKDTTDDNKQNPKKEYAKTAKKHLDLLREKDPKTVKRAERFFFLN